MITLALSSMLSLSSCSSADDVSGSKDAAKGKALTLDASILRTQDFEIKTRGIKLETAPMNPDRIIESTYEVSAEDETRTPMDATPTWAGMTSRDIAVKVGGNVYQYSVAADGKITCGTPYYFTTMNNVTVESWYPYTASYPENFSVQTDQRTYANYEKSDFMYGSTSSANQANLGNAVTYNHKIAKLIVKVNVSEANYMKGYGAINSVSFTGAQISATVGASGALSGSGATTSTVRMYAKVPSARNNNSATATFEACVIPQSAKLSFTLDIGGVTYTAAMASNHTFAAGSANELTINVNSARAYISSGGTIANGDYYCTTPSGQAWVVKQADLASSKTARNTTPIAVVFSTATSTTDKGHGWQLGYAMALQCATTGSGANGTCTWGPANEDCSYLTNWDNANPRTTWKNNKDGYTETMSIPSGQRASYPAFQYAINYQSTVAAPNTTSKWYLPSNGQWYDIWVNLGGAKADGTYINSGGSVQWDEIVWYGPSDNPKNETMYWVNLVQTNINALLNAVSSYASIYTIDYEAHQLYSWGEYFWCSSERSAVCSYVASVNKNGYVRVHARTGSPKSDTFRVRPVLAF
ncbi:MAG: fimbrillin family protein [Prevotella sp.]|nr:fimbrillin family protein [Prevotella sp.]